MSYNFDHVIDRRNTCSVKWDRVKEVFYSSDVLPMWIADMDFTAPGQVIDEIKKRAEHGAFGYTERPDSYYSAIINWLYARHQWKVEKGWIAYTPGVIPALNIAVKAFTEPGDRVLIQSPVYPPFFSAVVNNRRLLVNNRLRLVNGHYEIDFDDLEKKLAGNVKLFILCSPHNPVGRVWRKDELEHIGNMCGKYGIILVSDEIHMDIVYKGYKHIPAASLSEELAQRTVTCIAPSKTFNIPGLMTASVIIPNTGLLNRFSREIDILGIGMANVFGIVAAQTAYACGSQWLDGLLEYLEGNVNQAMSYFEENLPGIPAIKPEGTYMVWLDFRKLGMNDMQLKEFMSRKAKVGLNSGAAFGPGGEGFMRMNVACPGAVLYEGLSRIGKAAGRMAGGNIRVM